MNILLDIQASQVSYNRGIGRYTLSSVKTILSRNRKHNICLLLNNTVSLYIDDVLRELDGKINRDNIYIYTSLKSIFGMDRSNESRTKTAELTYESLVEKINPDVVLNYCLFSNFEYDVVSFLNKSHDIPTAVILYDLIPWILHEHYLSGDSIKYWYQEKFEQLKYADMLLAISDSSKQEAIKYLGFNNDNVINVYADSSEKFKNTNFDANVIKRIKKKYNIKQDFIAYTSAEDYRKNNFTLITAFSLLDSKIRASNQLVIICSMNNVLLNSLISHCRLCGLKENEVIFTNFIDDNELIVLYNICRLFIFPSLHEGFGLPVLEAMRCGAAVIGSNKTSIPEIIGNDKFMFDPYSPQSIADKLTQSLTDDDFYQEILENSRKQKLRFSWEKVADETISALEFLHDKTKTGRPRVKQEENTNQYLINTIAKSEYAKELTNNELRQLAKVVNENEGLIKIKSRKKQFFIDMSEFIKVDAKTGIPRVVKEVTKNIVNLISNDYVVRPIFYNEFCYFYAPEKIFSYFNLVAYEPNSPININKDDVFLGLDLCPNIPLSVFEYLKYHSYRGLKIYFVIYDIILLKNTSYHGPGIAQVYDNWLKNISIVSEGLIAISKSVLNDVEIYLHENHSELTMKRAYSLQLEYFHLGADFKKNDICKNKRKSNDKIIFLMVGWIDPRKGHKDILDVMDALWKEDFNIDLIIVGRTNANTESVLNRINSHKKNGTSLHFLGQVSDEELISLYTECSALIAASEDEGFGLPLVEASLYSLPIIARDIPIFREVANEHAFYFSNKKPEIIVENIKAWIELYKNNSHPKSENLPFLNWEQSTKDLLASIDVVI